MYDFDLPEGMSPAALRAHPLNQMLRYAATRDGLGIPSAAQLDALNLPPSARSKVVKAAKDVSALFDTGDQDPARNLADERTAEILGMLAPEFHAPDYLDDHTDPTDSMTPGELAEHILSRRLRP